MPWVAAGAAIGGDLLGMSGQKSTNAANMAMQKQAEQWQEQMSDTAMQRRVQDLKAAGLNVGLAYQQGGASTPGISPVTMQNPMASFQNLGQQAASAMSLKTQDAQIQQMKAQSDYTLAQTRYQDSVTADKLPAEIQNIQSQTGVNQEQAKVVHNNVEFIASQIANVREDTGLKNVQMLLQSQNYQVLTATRQYLIQQAAAQASTAGSQAAVAGRQGDIARSEYGKYLSIINALLQPIQSGAQVAGAFAR